MKSGGNLSNGLKSGLCNFNANNSSTNRNSNITSQGRIMSIKINFFIFTLALARIGCHTTEVSR